MFIQPELLQTARTEGPVPVPDNPLYAIWRASPGRAAYNDDGTFAQTAFSRDTQTI